MYLWQLRIDLGVTGVRLNNTSNFVILTTMFRDPLHSCSSLTEKKTSFVFCDKNLAHVVRKTRSVVSPALSSLVKDVSERHVDLLQEEA
jgi:hypothetical protein